MKNPRNNNMDDSKLLSTPMCLDSCETGSSTRDMPVAGGSSVEEVMGETSRSVARLITSSG